MNTSTTQRDKKILFFVLLIVVMIASVKFIIVPTYDKISKAKADNKVLTQKQITMKSEINNIESYKTQLSNIDLELKKIKDKVYNDFKEYDMDRSVTLIMKDNGVIPTRFDIESINGIDISEYDYKNYDTKSFGIVANDKSNMKAANISISAKGPAKNILKLLNSLDSQSGVFVKQADATFSEESTIQIKLSLILGENDY